MAVDSRADVLLVVAVALAFVWLSNPGVLFAFDDSVRNAAAVLLAAAVLTPGRRTVRPPWTVVALLGYGFLTAIWSTWSTLTLHFSLIYAVVAVIALAVSATVDSRTLAHGMLLGGVLYVLASLYAFKQGLAGAAVPLGTEGYLAGVGGNRNILSYTMIVALPFALSFFPRTWPGRGLWAIGLGTLFLGLFLSQSATGFVAAALLVAASAALGWRDRAVARTRDVRRQVGWPTRLLPAALAVVLAAALFRAVLALRGDEAVTLSGRTTLWSATWQSVEGWERWFGVGWGVVWQHPWYPPGQNDLLVEIVTRNGIWQPHGHNSFFDLLPEIGLVGCLLFALVHVRVLQRAIQARRIAGAPTRETLETSRVVLLGSFALLIYGLTEPMSTIPLGWFVLVLIASDLRPPRPRADDESPEDPAPREHGVPEAAPVVTPQS